MAKKILTSSQVKERREKINAEKRKEAEQRLIQFLMDKSLRMFFHFSLGMECLEHLKVTEDNYSQAVKLRGNQFLKELEKFIISKIDKLYNENPQWTTNFQNELDKTAKSWSHIMISDFPVINRMKEEFDKDPDHWRDNVRMAYEGLDSDKSE